MATNLVLNAVNAGGSLTLYGNESAAVTAHKLLIWTSLRSKRESPWDIVVYPGSNAIRAKFMGARPRQFVLAGGVIPSTEANVRAAMDLIYSLNKTREYFTITAGALLLHDGEGMIVEEIEDSFVGEGAVVWMFQLHMRNLGTT
jgi:hypothetical protein